MKHFLKTVCTVLCCLILFPAVAGCKETYALTYETTHVTAGMYSYWYSSYKHYYLSLYNGEDSDAYYGQILDSENGLTAGEYLDSQIKAIIDSNVASLYLFDSYGLTLSAQTKAEIDDAVTSEIENAGGRAKLNEILAKMNINIDVLHDVLEAEAKVQAIYMHLFGDEAQGISGVLTISDEDKQTFYEDHYVCVKQILLRTEEKNLVGEDGYALLDDEGNVMTEALNAEEKAAKLALADTITERAKAGENFDALMESYNEDSSADTFRQGYIIAYFSGFDATLTAIASALALGEIGRCETSVGVHILKREDLPEKPWDDEVYSTMLNQFTEYLNSSYYDKMTQTIVSKIRRNISATEGVTIANADISFWNQTGNVQ